MITNIKVEIKPSQVTIDRRSGVSKNEKAYTINEQKAYIHLGADYPQLIKINLEDNQPPYDAGFYNVTLDSFEVGRFDRLEVRRIKLVPADK